jgi:glycerol-3-phosphate dehydrogenase
VQRDLRSLSDTTFDVVVIGGGLFGAFAAWDAAQRGLTVALVERQDFGGATSANSFKIVHGGIRYLQHGDLYRIRQSSAERRALLRIAPHLVRPLPIVIPTSGSGMRGRAALVAGLAAYDALTIDRNAGIQDPARRVPRGRLLSRRQVLDLFPGLLDDDCTGGGLFYDGQFVNPPRLVLAVVQSAARAGAVVANYVEAAGFTRRADEVAAVAVTDRLTGAAFEVRCRAVLNAAGPYAESLAASVGLPLPTPGSYSRDACFVVPRRLLPHEYAVAVLGRSRDPDARLSRGARHLFLAPWRDYTLIGTWHRVQQPGSLDIQVHEDELARFVAEVNDACPGLRITPHDVSLWNAGLVPFGRNPDGAEDLRYGHRSQLIDHERAHGVRNAVTLIGVRLTTARFEAERAVNLIFRKLGRSGPSCRTAREPVMGGEIPDWETLVREAEAAAAGAVDSRTLRSLVEAHGTAYREVLRVPGAAPLRPIGTSATIRAQVVHAARAEMAVTLGDVILRRTDLGTGEFPGRDVLEECAEILAPELGWATAEAARQTEMVMAGYPAWEIARRHPRPAAAPGGAGRAPTVSR